MSKTEGPWYLHQMTTYEFMVAHKNYGPRKYNYQDGVKVVQELNKLEAIREAAPELLSACKDALEWIMGRSNPRGVASLVGNMERAIAKAEHD